MYNFSPWQGILRPYKQTPRREVPDTIVRPDYAEDSIPHSERKPGASTYLKVLTDEEIEDMRVACKVGHYLTKFTYNMTSMNIQQGGGQQYNKVGY